MLSSSLVFCIFGLVLYRSTLGLGAECRTNAKYISGGIKDCGERQLILDIHNKYREMVASGNVKTQPKAQNMVEMRWSDALEKKAQEWADTCAFQHDPDLQINKKSLGQNLAMVGSSRDSLRETDYEKMIYLWFNEVNEYGYDGNYNPKAGHYSQMIWADSVYIGCGVSYYFESGFYRKYLVCNYYKAGNVIGQKPYKYGDVNCSGNKLSSSQGYKNLCAIDDKAYNVCNATQADIF